MEMKSLTERRATAAEDISKPTACQNFIETPPRTPNGDTDVAPRRETFPCEP